MHGPRDTRLAGRSAVFCFFTFCPLPSPRRIMRGFSSTHAAAVHFAPACMSNCEPVFCVRACARLPVPVPLSLFPGGVLAVGREASRECGGGRGHAISGPPPKPQWQQCRLARVRYVLQVSSVQLYHSTTIDSVGLACRSVISISTRSSWT